MFNGNLKSRLEKVVGVYGGSATINTHKTPSPFPNPKLTLMFGFVQFNENDPENRGILAHKTSTA